MPITRRDFLRGAAFAVGGLALGRSGVYQTDDLGDFIRSRMEAVPIPGLGACVVQGDRIVWMKGFGWANIESRIPYNPEHTIQNIGSVSKTLTATAVMQLWEKGRFKLDDNINDYLPFDVKHPRYPNAPVTFRQLLTHRSAIKDGPSYGKSYACGDPAVSLEKWLKEYFTPGGKHYDPKGNFHAWEPGQEGTLPKKPRNYSNVGFGLLGFLVEAVSGMSFREYCRRQIFEPLEMKDTGWHLKDIDTARHARPYTYIPAKSRRRLLKEGGFTLERSEEGGFYAHCLYSFYNYPDGLIRTTVRDLASFLMAYIKRGTYHQARILERKTVRLMLSRDHFGRGLCWVEQPTADGGILWGHGGGDPGVNTAMHFRPKDGVGVILFANTDNARLGSLIPRLFNYGPDQDKSNLINRLA